MKEIILKYIEYLERKRKSKDLWRLLKNAESDVTINRQVLIDLKSEEAYHELLKSIKEIEKLKNQIKLL